MPNIFKDLQHQLWHFPENCTPKLGKSFLPRSSRPRMLDLVLFAQSLNNFLTCLSGASQSHFPPHKFVLSAQQFAFCRSHFPKTDHGKSWSSGENLFDWCWLETNTKPIETKSIDINNSHGDPVDRRPRRVTTELKVHQVVWDILLDDVFKATPLWKQCSPLRCYLVFLFRLTHLNHVDE